MVNVNSRFHTLVAAANPQTRIRIYFFGAGVDCTDDNDVQTNGTLLKLNAGDTDSNGRIGQDGVRFAEFFNPEYNVQMGRAVSSQVSMTLVNSDGALNNFGFGMCKIYLDVYDSSYSTWRVCPMGVYDIKVPVKRKVQLVSVSGFDQMQKLDEICDSWWNGLNFSGGLTISSILSSMASQLGVSISSGTSSAILNSSVSYTTAPLTCVQVTYRELLESITEATGTVARFDRNGYLDLRWFSKPTISGNPYKVDTSASGNHCLSIDISDAQVAKVDAVKVKIAEDDIGVVVGSGTNAYVIINNLFLNGSTATIITNRATPIYNRLNAFSAYNPIQTRMVWDWSLEAGDIYEIVYDGATYSMPIFQQDMTWKGGYVVSSMLNSGDPVRPLAGYNERATYRMESEMSAKVGDNEIISKINQSAEGIEIQANKISLLGYTTINNGFKVNLDGTFEANGANINGTTKTVSGNDSVEMSGGKLVFKHAGTEHFSLEYDSNFTQSVVLNMNDSNGKKRVRISGADSDPNIEMFASDGSTTVAKLSPDLLHLSDTYTPLDPNHFSYDKNTGVDIGGNVSLDGNLSVSGDISADDATVSGLLDLPKFRSNNVLPTNNNGAGWYRVMTGSPIGYQSTGALIKFRIVQYGDTGGVSSNHEITLSLTTSGTVFQNETSNGTQHVTKIRCNRNTDATEVYVDIYYDDTTKRTVDVFFEPYLYAPYRAHFTSNAFTKVSASPAYETNLTVYDFSSDIRPTYLKQYVEASAANYTIGSSNYLEMTYPLGLTGNKVVSIGLATWSNNSGPFAIFPYGITQQKWYIVGAAGTTINGAKFKYWYID